MVCLLNMVLEESEAFYSFVYIIERILPLDYYIEMKGVQKDFKFFE